MKDIKKYIKAGKELARISELIIMKYFNSIFDVEYKKDKSPVTIADKKAEEQMRKFIRKNFPEHGIIGEEENDINTNAQYTWVLDPIDGTKSFVCGVPIFGTLISLLKDKKPILGIMNFPALKEIIIGVKGRETIVNSKKTRVSNISAMKDVTMLCTDHLEAVKYHDEEKFVKLASRVKLYRNWGDCFMYALLVKGKVDVVMDPVMSFWDIQALIPIVEGAGGIITSWEGEKPENAKSMIASNSFLHKKVLKCLN